MEGFPFEVVLLIKFKCYLLEQEIFRILDIDARRKAKDRLKQFLHNLSIN